MDHYLVISRCFAHLKANKCSEMRDLPAELLYCLAPFLLSAISCKSIGDPLKVGPATFAADARA